MQSSMKNFISDRRAIFWLLTFSLVVWMLSSHHAYASESLTGLEWEQPFQAFYRSITGPVAFGIAFLGIVVCGAILIWGGEINEFVRRMVMVILVTALIMFAGSILRRLFAGGAATIPSVTVSHQANSLTSITAVGSPI